MSIVRLPVRASPPSDACVVVYRHGQRVVCVVGRHDRSTVAKLSGELAEVISWDERDLNLNLTGVQFMDTSTVAAFLRAQIFLAARGRGLHLQAPSAPARRVLDLCHVDYDTAATPPRGPDLRLVKGAVTASTTLRP